MDLTDKVVIVTGSSRGIGAATAIAFAGKGARVVIHYKSAKSKKEAEKVARACKAELCVPADLESLKDCRTLIDAVVKKYGRIDVLVNNAGISLPVEEGESLEERWQKHMDVNLRAPFFLSQYAKDHMPAGGCVVNLASIRAFRPSKTNARLSVYGISKAGLVYLTKSLALFWAESGIRVNAVAPGYVDTDMLNTFYKDKTAEVAKQMPINRLIKPEEIASAVVFLAENDAVTGHTLVVDGGYLIQ